MREGWRRVTLGDVTEPVSRPHSVKAEDTYRTLGVRAKGKGVFERESQQGSAIKANRLFAVQPGDFVYNRLFAGTGSFGIVLAEHEGAFVSNEFPLFRCDPEVLISDYLFLLFQQTRVWQLVEMECTGTTQSRSRWKEERFNKFVVDLPPLAEQKRIVDLIAAVDEAIAAAGVLQGLARIAGDAYLAGHSDLSTGEVPIADLIAHTIGGVWGAEPGAGEIDATVVRSTEFTNDGVLAASEVVRSITRTQLRSRELRHGDILLEKSGGGPNQPVGRVVWVDDPEPRTVCANFVQLVRPDPEKVEPKYLFYRLFDWHRRGRTLTFQNQTTGIRNLRTKDYLSQPISLPSRKRQREVVETVDALVAVADRARREAEALRNLRAAFISDLLSGAHEIPASYDDLLAEAV
jgi:type I restriction enzyme S subunit